jgi:MFS family permease
VPALGRSFHALWAATGTANLADGMALFALPLLALAAGASPGGVAAVTAVATSAWPLFGLHAGWLVDRVSCRAMLIWVNLGRAAVLVVVTGLYATGALSLPVILVAAGLLGVAETLVDTALTSTVPLVVQPAARPRANARLEAAITLANQLLGPPLAGLLAGLTLALTTGASAVLYALTLAGLGMMRIRGVRSSSGRGHGSGEAHGSGLGHGSGLAAGLRHVWREPVLRMLTLFTAGMNLVWAAATALLVVHLVRPGPLGLTEAQYGLLLTAMAAGGLLAATVVEPLRRRLGVTTLLVADCVGTVLLVAPVAAGGGVWLVAAGVVVAGAGIWRILVATIRQSLAPPDLLGRVYAASRVVSWGVLPAGAGLAGLGAELWGVRTVFVIATVLAVVVLAGFVGFARGADLSGATDPVPIRDLPDRPAEPERAGRPDRTGSARPGAGELAEPVQRV